MVVLPHRIRIIDSLIKKNQNNFKKNSIYLKDLFDNYL
jgi:hypothetical protein